MSAPANKANGRRGKHACFLYYYFSVYVSLVKELFSHALRPNERESGCKGTNFFSIHQIFSKENLFLVLFFSFFDSRRPFSINIYTL